MQNRGWKFSGFYFKKSTYPIYISLNPYSTYTPYARIFGWVGPNNSLSVLEDLLWEYIKCMLALKIHILFSLPCFHSDFCIKIQYTLFIQHLGKNLVWWYLLSYPDSSIFCSFSLWMTILSWLVDSYIWCSYYLFIYFTISSLPLYASFALHSYLYHVMYPNFCSPQMLFYKSVILIFIFSLRHIKNNINIETLLI